MDGKESACITNQRRHIHLRENGTDSKTFLSAYYDDKGQRGDITNEDVSKALKAAATVLEYPTVKGISIDRIDTHSLRSGSANALFPLWLLRYPNSKDGMVARCHVQRIHPRGAGMFLQRDVKEHENEIRFC